MRNNFLLAVISLFISHSLKAQDVKENKAFLSDSIFLEEISVVGFDSKTSLKNSVGSISYISEKKIESDGTGSLFQTLNTVAGVQFEERSPGSYRINIRGSSIRSPFDVRNVKIYWRGIPITEPGGNTPFNIFNMGDLGAISIIRGPGSSKYGSGNGGVISFDEPSKEVNNTHVKFGSILGSYGTVSNGISFTTRNEISAHSVVLNTFKTDGYREHSNLNRKTINYSGNFYHSDQYKTSVNILLSDLFYQIPGGINKSQYDEDASQARPGNNFAMGSVESNSSIDTKNIIVGVTEDVFINEFLQNKTTIYGTFGNFENPFILDYKREQQKGFGGRSEFEYEKSKVSAGAGVEFQYRNANSDNFGNISGKIDTVNFRDEISTSALIFYTHLKYKLLNNLSISGGIGLNYLNYEIDRVEDALAAPNNFTKVFDPTISPRLSLSWLPFETLNIFAMLSSGFSPPTLEEVRTNEGSVNTNLKSEIGRNNEFGIRYAKPGNGVYFEAVAFSYSLNNTIVDYTSTRGTDLFRNAGSTNQNGLELMLGYNLGLGSDFTATLNSSYTYHNFTFEDYINSGIDYSGMMMPGISPNSLSFDTIIKYRDKFSISLNYLFKDEIPLNDDLTIYSDLFHLLNTRLNYCVGVGNFDFTIFGAINNLLNEKYSLGNDLNAFGGRYFQPAWPINYQMGAIINFNSNKNF